VLLGELKPNEKNPRKITDEKLKMLKKSLDAFGDLSGVIFNKRTKRLVGGHQRLKVLPVSSEITITNKLKEPTEKGTVAEGFISIGTEKFVYREVDWDETTEKAANLAANKHGGEFDFPQLIDWLQELDALNVDLELTGFDAKDLENIMAPVLGHLAEGKENKTDFETVDITCPSCGHCFTKSSIAESEPIE
jgi:hypothetical protein